MQRCTRLGVALAGQFPCSLQSENTHVSPLPESFIGALWLSERLLVPGYVEDVVDDLEQDAEFRCESGERDCRTPVQTFQSEYGSDRRADQPTGLELVQMPQPRGVQALRGRDVHVLAADHPRDRGRARDLPQSCHDVRGL